MEKSKFAGALANVKTPMGDSAPEVRVGRPPGKSSNPKFTTMTVLIEKETKKKAQRALVDLDQGQDLSELVQQLLSEWIAKQS